MLLCGTAPALVLGKLSKSNQHNHAALVYTRSFHEWLHEWNPTTAIAKHPRWRRFCVLTQSLPRYIFPRRKQFVVAVIAVVVAAAVAAVFVVVVSVVAIVAAVVAVVVVVISITSAVVVLRSSSITIVLTSSTVSIFDQALGGHSLGMLSRTTAAHLFMF